MTRPSILILLTSLVVALVSSCGGDSDHTVPTTTYTVPGDTLAPDKIYDWESSRTAIADYSDMVLLYGGGRQRYTYLWQANRLESYVTYVDTDGKEHWLFDAFLFIEFADYGTGSAEVNYATGYSRASATQSDWQRLIDYYFQDDSGIGALDAVIGKAIARLGTPKEKHKVIITIPEPITHANYTNTSSSTVYWGSVGGRKLDFQYADDRVKACQWYIDQCRAAFDAKGYKNVELAGFYWLPEKSTYTSGIISKVGDYLHTMKYSFNWIPYYTADGYSMWQYYNFDYAYLQPNYFFNTATPKSRLTDAVKMAKGAGMGGMEVEFDDNCLDGYGRAYKLEDYMEVFQDQGIWASYRLAYYQGNNTVHTLRQSTNAANQALYHKFCNFVITRPTRRL
jgi:hypothetical protein